MTPPPLAGRLAELAVGVGANVQPGPDRRRQRRPRQEELVRAVVGDRVPARGALRRRLLVRPAGQAGADRHARGGDARLRAAVVRRRASASSARPRGAVVDPDGAVEPGALDGLDPERPAATACRGCAEWMEVIDDAARSTGRSCPARPRRGRGSSTRSSTTRRRSSSLEEIAHVCRLDEPDPAAAWRARCEELPASAAARRARRFDALQFEGPGTDLTVGLLPSSRWIAAATTTRDGLGTCRTCRPRRSSRRPTRSASRATCARRSRSSSATARSCAASRCASRAAARSRSTPRRAPR